MEYEQRVVAFIDILGFRALLDETVDRDNNDIPDKIDDVITAYKSIRQIWNLDDPRHPKIRPILETLNSKRITIFSDSIVVSFKADEPSEVFHTLLEVKHLIISLLNLKILCRGAVSLGKLIHDDKYIFGPALIEAYTLESKAALYPRVILDRNIIECSIHAKKNKHSDSQEIKYIESLLNQDSDGMYYIDYFHKAQTELDNPEYDFPHYIKNLGNIIRKGLMGSSHHKNVDVRIKYSWMRERYNQMIKNVTSKEYLERLIHADQPELAKEYESLKPISPGKS